MPKEASINIFTSQAEAAAVAAEMGKQKFDVIMIGPVSLVMVADQADGAHDFETSAGGKYFIVIASKKG